MPGKPSLDSVRRSNRFRVVLNLPMRIGFKSGTLVDISEAGILATHSGMLKTGSSVEIGFDYQGEHFQATTEVTACTVVGLGAGDGGATLYASRLHFTRLGDTAQKILSGMIGNSSTPAVPSNPFASEDSV